MSTTLQTNEIKYFHSCIIFLSYRSMSGFLTWPSHIIPDIKLANVEFVIMPYATESKAKRQTVYNLCFPAAVSPLLNYSPKSGPQHQLMIFNYVCFR